MYGHETLQFLLNTRQPADPMILQSYNRLRIAPLALGPVALVLTAGLIIIMITTACGEFFCVRFTILQIKGEYID